VKTGSRPKEGGPIKKGETKKKSGHAGQEKFSVFKLGFEFKVVLKGKTARIKQFYDFSLILKLFERGMCS
jgi:hypothetical protein